MKKSPILTSNEVKYQTRGNGERFEEELDVQLVREISMKSLGRRTQWPFAMSFLLFVTMFSATACSDLFSGKETFTEYKQQSGRFTIRWPGSAPPKEVRETSAYAMTQLRKGVIYAISWDDYDLPANLSDEEFIEIQDNAMRREASTVLRRTEVSFNGFKGVEFEFRESNGDHNLRRHLRTENRMYSLYMTGDGIKLNLAGETAQTFLTSFKVH